MSALPAVEPLLDPVLNGCGPAVQHMSANSANSVEQQLRHTISEVAARTGLTTHTLRWYERIGLLDPVDRSHSGRRLYSDGDLNRLAFLVSCA